MSYRDKTLSERELRDVTALTDNSGGTASDTVGVISATYSQAEVANAVASLTAKVNELLDHVKKG